MEKFNSNCPSCGERMRIRNLSCGSCGLSLEGEMELPKLARLTPEDREFVELFTLSGGSLKEVGRILGISYPTVRGRLDHVISNLKSLDESSRKRRMEILEKLEKGEIKTEEALKVLKELE